MDPVVAIERPVLLGVKIRRIVEILSLPLSHFDDSSETVLCIITDHTVLCADLTSILLLFLMCESEGCSLASEVPRCVWLKNCIYKNIDNS